MSIAIGGNIIAGNANISNADVLCNPNFVINPNFQINTKGKASYSTPGEICVDKWNIYVSESTDIEFTATPTSTGLRLAATGLAANAFCYIKQKLSIPIPNGKTFTITIKVSDIVDPISFTIINDTSLAVNHIYAKSSSASLQSTNVLRAVWYAPTNEIAIRAYTSEDFIVEYVKIEYGENSTMLVAPDPIEEIIKCSTTTETNGVITKGYTEISSKPNILINSNFKINQRGEASYNITGYTFDRWYTNGCGITPVDNGINISIGSTGYLVQPVEFLRAGTYTISAKVSSVTNGSLSFKIGNDITSYIEEDGIAIFTFTITENMTNVPVGLIANISENAIIEWIKLETGPIASLYADPDPEIELSRCQRYYQIRSANSINAIDLRPIMRATPLTYSVTGGYAYDAEIDVT